MLDNYVKKAFGSFAIAVVFVGGIVVAALVHFDKVDWFMGIVHGLLG